ncbi:uncharacterized protein FFFS_16044 [Fusarium fujikuroi]|nr:uncharacterized protein FFFS_16044 [Fusarium fujikuroi]
MATESQQHSIAVTSRKNEDQGGKEDKEE